MKISYNFSDNLHRKAWICKIDDGQAKSVPGIIYFARTVSGPFIIVKLRILFHHNHWSNSLDYPIKHFILTPGEAEEKALIVARIKINSRSRWSNGKKMILPEPKAKTPKSKKKN